MLVWEILGKPMCLSPSVALRTVSYLEGRAQHWTQAHLGTGSELNAAEVTRLGSRDNDSSVVALYSKDKSWGMMMKHKQIPFTKKFS